MKKKERETAVHPLVTQLRFARSEFLRCLRGLSAADGEKRLSPTNSISWMIGHLANQEQFYWVICGQGRFVVPGLNDLVGTGKPAATPPLDEMWAAWQTVTTTADQFLDQLTPEQLMTHLSFDGDSLRENIGTCLLRTNYHYWFHIGEAHAVRQQLGHANLPEFVGDISAVRFSI